LQENTTVSGEQHVRLAADGREIITRRLRLRPWAHEDVDAAFAIFGDPQVSRWLTPAMERIVDRDVMLGILQGWIAEADNEVRPTLGSWAIEPADSQAVIGAVSLLQLPPGGKDVGIGWQVNPRLWGQGYGAEAGHAVAHRAFVSGIPELFAALRPANRRAAAAARRVGTEWVGETTKYYDMPLQVYRLVKADLDYPRPAV
jgi:RimJ/RimL family protein N-acetyltransferase